MENKIICSICGEDITNKECREVDGKYYCEDCFDNNFIECADCEEIIPKDEATWIDDGSYYVCNDCLESNYEYCQDCEECVSCDSTTYINGHGYVCDHCRDWGDYDFCEDCQEWYEIDDMIWSDEDDCYYCRDCWTNNHANRQVYDYHGFGDWHLFKGKNEENAPYYIGKEIELEPKECRNVNGLMDIVNKYINAVGMHDSSLRNGGVEVVTHPESWQYLLEKKEDYRKFFEEVESIKYGDDGGAGLHFHVTRPSEDTISRIIVILESFKDEIKKLSRRNGDFSWSKFLTDMDRNIGDKLKYQSTKFLKEKYINNYHDRYLALNLCNSRTIEFRFFNGANNFQEFWGALEFIHNIMEVALDEKRELNTISWKDLLKGEELEEEAKKHNVYDIVKYAKDTTDMLDKIEKAQKDMKEDIRKTLKNFIKYLSKEMEEKRLEIVNRNDIYAIERNGQDFLNTLTNELNYLHRLTNLYSSLEDVEYSVESTKNSIENIKYYTRSMDKYSRYFKQMDKTIKKFESEVYA